MKFLGKLPTVVRQKRDLLLPVNKRKLAISFTTLY